MIIDRCQWSINKEILAYWEGIGKTILCYGQEWSYEGAIYGASIYFYDTGAPEVSIGTDDKNVIAHKSTSNFWRYKFNNTWYAENEIMKIIKLKAFL